MNWTPWARIILRYGSGALATWGILSQEAARAAGNDADLVAVVAMLLGLGVPVLVEGFYVLARRKGWAT